MIEITSQGPLNRHITEFLTTTPGLRQYRCKTLQNPDFYYNGQIFAPVDVAAVKDTVSNAGAIWLRDKGIVSVGYKKADDAYKLFGLRPDEKQDGSEQFEVSIESIEINGQAQTINLRDRLPISPITTKFGDNIFIQEARQRCRVMVPGDSGTEDFKISLRLHMTGLTPIYRDDLDEWWIYNTSGQFRFRLGKPYLVDPATMNPLNTYQQSLVKHSLVEISEGEYRYVKEPTETFGKVTLPTSYLIDADTVYSSISDGEIYAGNADWATARNATTGTVSTASTQSDLGAGILYSGGVIYIERLFFYYALTSLSGTVSSCSENLYGVTNNQSNVCTQQGTQATSLVSGDYDSFSGSSFGNTDTWSKTSNNAITYNAAGISAVQTVLGSTMKTCVREFAHDYSDVTSGTSSYQNGCYLADQTGTDKDPYLSITMAAVGIPRRNPFSRPFSGPLGGNL